MVKHILLLVLVKSEMIKTNTVYAFLVFLKIEGYGVKKTLKLKNVGRPLCRSHAFML